MWLRCSTIHAICKSKDIITTTNSDGTTVSMNENLGSQDFEILVAMSIMSAICRTPDLWGRTITAVTVSGTFLGWSSGTSSDPHGLVSMAVVAKVTEVSVIQSKVEGLALSCFLSRFAALLCVHGATRICSSIFDFEISMIFYRFIFNRGCWYFFGFYHFFLLQMFLPFLLRFFGRL